MMITYKAQTQPASKIVVRPSSTGRVAMMPDTAPPQDRIREWAYELYESRGCESGLPKFQQNAQRVPQKSGSSSGKSSLISPESSGEESRFDVMA